MTDFKALIEADTGQSARNIQLLDVGNFETWLKGQPENIRALVTANQFSGKADSFLLLPPVGGKSEDKSVATDFSVVAGVPDQAKLDAWSLARLGSGLPEGNYRLQDVSAKGALFGWLISQHEFDRYKELPDRQGPSVLLVNDAIGQRDEAVRQAEATAMVRDLVNTPAADMGPDRLEDIVDKLAGEHGAELKVTRGDTLEEHFPMIHGVGKAAMRAHAPRLLELKWGRADHPKIAIVGKGVTFDSGGLSMKSPAGMMLMKKDMGGAAHAIALARMVMEARLPVQLHLLVPAVENAIDGNALRPGDILHSRKGLTVEITNTDAEGRLVLGDALTLAGEQEPELIIDFATLTGAARVALGPDLPAMFCDDRAMADGLLQAGEEESDPLWQMPLWSGYDAMLSSNIADCVNSASGGFAGCITAALFLKKFAPESVPWAHFDTFAWRPAAKPGRPQGGEALGLRASWRYLQGRYGQ
ncbi:leucyl aminopeptidase family protein [Sphingorhabdus sp. YGSMI21]|uniref:leucyl aminopeptidase family protein n=1 Tax=Sphingorhabdus sp. YGSMI21 TaxID=2077182 RepID=UPI000C1E3E49|nr:leucyl aminopeptidase family protein [Sphingorhabdus sp. YGSMI21]ATW03780.1 aminopeptidase [Sphingorhabdus sp. YGSMI21]